MFQTGYCQSQVLFFFWGVGGGGSVLLLRLFLPHKQRGWRDGWIARKFGTDTRDAKRMKPADFGNPHPSLIEPNHWVDFKQSVQMKLESVELRGMEPR